jgi:hypothetical protein
MEAFNMRQASGGAKWGKPGEGPVQKYRINDKHRMCEVQQFVARLLTSFLTIRPPNNVASSEATSPKILTTVDHSKYRSWLQAQSSAAVMRCIVFQSKSC